MIIGISASESKFNLHSLFEWYSLASNSDPHAADMGRVESEPAVVHYSSNPLHPFWASVFIIMGPMV
jgi:hypothetical protein